MSPLDGHIASVVTLDSRRIVAGLNAPLARSVPERWRDMPEIWRDSAVPTCLSSPGLVPDGFGLSDADGYVEETIAHFQALGVSPAGVFDMLLSRDPEPGAEKAGLAGPARDLRALAARVRAEPGWLYSAGADWCRVGHLIGLLAAAHGWSP